MTESSDCQRSFIICEIMFYSITLSGWRDGSKGQNALFVVVHGGSAMQESRLSVCANNSFRPGLGLCVSTRPTAYAVGCILTPLCGLEFSAFSRAASSALRPAKPKGIGSTRQQETSGRLPFFGSQSDSTNLQNLGTAAFRLATTNSRCWEIPAAWSSSLSKTSCEWRWY
jgi:hypothetical protein